MSVAVDFRNVDICFGKDIPNTLKMIDAGASRAEILAKTGAVLGAAGANLTVNEGEISVLMGLSGSGKSTLLRAVNGLNKVSRGSVMVKDGDRMVDVANCDPETLRHIRQTQVAMVFQQFALLPWRTVRENAGFGLELAGVSPAEVKERVDAKLKLVGLDSWADKHVHELSGGMQQRVGLARAFATDAPILLMDEPFSALDPLIRTKLQDELIQLQKSIKKTIIFVSHDLEEAVKLGNRVTIMEGGRIVQSGSPEEIVLQPANDYVSDFIANVNPLSVLTAWNVMRDKRDLEKTNDGWVWLDRQHTTRFRLDADDRIVAAECMNRPVTWVCCDDANDRPAEDASVVYWARPATNLKTVILAMHRSGTAPVALCDAEDRFVGGISVSDLLQAILRRKPEG